MRLKNWRFYIKRVEVFKTSTLFYFILILWFQRRRCLFSFSMFFAFS
jgi:hypothetical protein